MHTYNTYQELRSAWRDCADSGDPWGSAMAMFFAVANEMSRRGDITPREWMYQCGALGPHEPESYEDELASEASDDALLSMGRVLNRYTDLLRRYGRDY